MQIFMNQCAEIEDVVAQIYREMAATVAADDELKGVWLSLADDEDEHAREILLAKRMLKSEVLNEEWDSGSKIKELLAQAHELQKRVRRGGLSVRKALQLSLYLEEHFRQVHVLCTVDFCDDGLRRLFERLGKADQEHVARLTDCCRRFIDGRKDAGETTAGAHPDR